MAPVACDRPLCDVPKGRNSLSDLTTATQSAYVHNFVFRLKIRHEDVFQVRHSGERDGHFARDELVNVGRQVFLESLSEVLAQVEGRVENTKVPVPSSLDGFDDDLYQLVCRGGRQTHKGMRHPGGGTAS